MQALDRRQPEHEREEINRWQACACWKDMRSSSTLSEEALRAHPGIVHN
jgi:hypothetical protein